jgi:HAD superfamily phosphoserine phosphatase-like hydrolase
MNYTLFDWDNTLRKGFSLISWVDFLIKKKLINDTALFEINNYYNKFQKKEIDHEEFVKNICKEYASSVNRKIVNDFVILVDEYINTVEYTLFFPFTKQLIMLMHENDIKPIIISGAPKIILKRIMEKLDIFKIFAFSPKINNGIYSDQIHECYGVEKEKIVAKLIKLYKTKPLFAFGDSKSDFPMLDSAKYPFLITDSKIPISNSYEVINTDDDCSYIFDDIKTKILSL